MAGTVTWSLLRELAGFRAEKGCAISLYLNLDPSDVPTAGDAQTRMNSCSMRPTGPTGPT